MAIQTGSVFDLLHDGIKGALDFFGIGTPIYQFLGSQVNEDKVENLIKDLNKLRLSRTNKIADLEKLVDTFNINDVSIPGALSQALAKEKRDRTTSAEKQLSQARANDELARTFEERLIDVAERPTQIFGDKNSRNTEEAQRLKEKINAIQEKFSEERL